MRWDTRTNICAAAGGSLRDGGEKLGGALLAVLFGSHGFTSCCHNTSMLGFHPPGRQKHAWHPPRNHGRSMTHAAWHDDASGSCQSNRQSRPWRGRPRRCSSCPSRLRSVWPKEASPASKSTSEVTLIALYDVGMHVAVLAHGALPALLAVADGHLSRLAAHGGWAE